MTDAEIWWRIALRTLSVGYFLNGMLRENTHSLVAAVYFFLAAWEDYP